LSNSIGQKEGRDNVDDKRLLLASSKLSRPGMRGD